jgi:sRNA-binding carbon storage regulator CsrA
LNARRGSVRLGFIAPVDVPIHRKEVALRIEKNAADRRLRSLQ